MIKVKDQSSSSLLMAIGEIVDIDKAVYIYMLRAMAGFSYRAVARDCHEEFPLWDYATHQEVGLCLCLCATLKLELPFNHMNNHITTIQL